MVAIAVLLLSCATALGTAASAASLDSAEPVVFNASDLRSAYLLRAGHVSYDRDRSPQSLQRQLQRHFDIVLTILRASTQHSIEIAVARIESKCDHRWSESERARWAQKLLMARWIQLQRLAIYRDRGRFPINSGIADRPVPIFVDEQDTACAVGQLMRWDDWESEVDAIRRHNNFVYVPEAGRSAVAAWVAQSGLTIEEAALIQPGYAGPPPTTTLGNLLPAGSFIDYNGLRYSNFTIKRETGNYAPPLISPNQGGGACNSNPNLCEPTFSNSIEVFSPDANPIAIALGSGTFASPQNGNIKILPYGTQWMFIGAAYGQGGLAVNGNGQSAQRLTLGFQVEALSPNNNLSKLVLGMSGFMGGLFDFSAGRIDTTVYGSAVSIPGFGVIPIDRLGSANMDSAAGAADSGYFVNDPFEITGRKSVYVLSHAYHIPQNFSPLDGFVLHFNVVPEPTGSILAAVCLFIASARHTRTI